MIKFLAIVGALYVVGKLLLFVSSYGRMRQIREDARESAKHNTRL